MSRPVCPVHLGQVCICEPTRCRHCEEPIRRVTDRWLHIEGDRWYCRGRSSVAGPPNPEASLAGLGAFRFPETAG